MSNLSNKGVAKVFSTLTSVATVLSLSGVAFLAPVATLAVTPADYGLQEGWTVSVDGSATGDPNFDPDIYIVNDWGYKRLFLNPVIFNFYGHLGGFAAVHHVSPAARDAFGTSGLFRNCETNDTRVYGVEVQAEDTGMLHWVNMSGDAAVAEDSNFFKKVFCINNNEFNWYTNGGSTFGANYTSLSQIPPYSRGTPVTPTGALSVSLASSNPVAGTIVDGQARYDLAEFMFSGSGTVTSLKLKRIGVSADASLTNVYLYDGTRRITDAVTVSSSEMLFNDPSGLFTVSGPKVISVIADINGTAGETIGVQVLAFNGVNLSSPISGNLHTIAAATLADVTFAAVTTPSDGSDNSTDNTGVATDPADDVIVWQDTASVTQRYVWLKSIQLRVIGSVAASDVQSFRLYVDGIQAGSAVAQRDANGYVLFDVSSSPVKLETGSRVLKVLANVVGGSGKDMHLSLRQKSDFWAVDSQYGAAVLSSTTFPIGDVDNEIEINSGSLTITKTTDSPAGDVVKGASGVVLGRYEFKAAGEKMKVENLRINNTTGSGGPLALRNAALFADGVQVGSTTTLWEDSDTNTSSHSAGTDYAEVSLGSSLIVTPGTPRMVEIRADIYDASGTDNTADDQTFTANIDTGSSNVQRMVTLDYVNGPTAVKAANQLTIQTGTFSAAKYTGYANQSVVAPKNGVKLGHFTLISASSEDVAVNTLTFDAQSAYGSGSLTGDFTDAYAKVWNDAGSLVYTSSIKSTFSNTASNSYSVSFTIPKNKTYQIELWGNVTTSFDPDTEGEDQAVVSMDAAGTTVGSSTSVTASGVNGQTISAAAGAFTVANGTLPAATLVNGGSTKNVYNFTITPTYDDYYLDEVYVDILTPSTASNSGAVASLLLKDGSTTLATAVLNSTTGSASFTGLNLSLPQSSGTKTLSVDVQFSNVGVGANDTGGNVTLYLDGYKNRNSGGTVTTVKGLATATYAANAHRLVKGYPTFTNASLPTTVLSVGTMTLFKTVVSATGGQVAWNLINFTVASTSGTIDIQDADWKLFENGVDITSAATLAVASTSGTTDRIKFTFATERVISAGNSVTIELKGTTSAAPTTKSISTQLTNPNGSTVSTLNSTNASNTNTPSFVWTDQSAPSHGTGTSDWFTDGLVKALAETQAVQAP